MIRRAVAAVVAALLVAGCQRAAEQPPVNPNRQSRATNPFLPVPVDETPDRINLLNFAHGAAIVSRTGEASLLQSALAAIDGDPASLWTSLPKQARQTFVASLPARSRIERIGLRANRPPVRANRIEVETSIDGTTFTKLATVTATNDRPLLINVPPTEARYLRVTMDGEKPEADTALGSVYVQGAELEAAAVPSIAGCWSVNGNSALFAERRGRAIGAIATPAGAMRLDGGSNGRAYRFAWIRNNEFGVALVSISPDGQHLSGEYWHEEPIPLFFAESWFGERRTCGTQLADRGEVPAFFLRHSGRYPLFGLHFDASGTFDVANSMETLGGLAGFIRSVGAQPLRVVAHEFRNGDAAKNRAAAEREIAAVRATLQRGGIDVTHVQFVAAGDANPREEPITEAMRALYSSVDVEIQR